MSNMKLAVLGAAGRMGCALIRQIDKTAGAELCGALERDGSAEIGSNSGLLAGIGENAVPISSDVESVLEEADAIIDFTAPAASVEMAQMVGRFNCIHVIGTTGCTPQQDATIAEAASSATIIKSGNMSLGVNLLSALVEKAAEVLGPDEFDIEVLEMHHKHKVDAPSGTALLLGEAAATGRRIDLATNSVRSRDGITGARETGTIGFATLRGGAVIGDHTVIFAGEGERLEFSHKAQDRSLFASGAVRSALWASGKPHGLYSMRDVLGL